MIGEKQYWNLLEIDPEFNPEYQLYESLIEEFTEIAGFPINYFVKIESDSMDPIYGEDPNTGYSSAFRTKIVYEPTVETNLLDAFGISSEDVIQNMHLPRTMFTEHVLEKYQNEYNTTESFQPKAGDAIRTLWNNLLYEIVDIGTEEKIFQGRKSVYEFIVRPFRYSKESSTVSDVVFAETDIFETPEINIKTETDELEDFGDNDEIEAEGDDIADIDTSFYGYNLE